MSRHLTNDLTRALSLHHPHPMGKTNNRRLSCVVVQIAAPVLFNVSNGNHRNSFSHLLHLLHLPRSRILGVPGIIPTTIPRTGPNYERAHLLRARREGALMCADFHRSMTRRAVAEYSCVHHVRGQTIAPPTILTWALKWVDVDYRRIQRSWVERVSPHIHRSAA